MTNLKLFGNFGYTAANGVQFYSQVEHLLQGGRVGDVVSDRDRGAVRRAGACRHERVADQQRFAAVDAEDAAPRVRVSGRRIPPSLFCWRSS